MQIERIAKMAAFSVQLKDYLPATGNLLWPRSAARQRWLRLCLALLSAQSYPSRPLSQMHKAYWDFG